MPTETYRLSGCVIRVEFENQVIRVGHPEETKKYLSEDIDSRTQHLASLIKGDYKKHFNKPLKIREQSIIVEIWAHVFASYVAKWVQRIGFKKIGEFIITKSDQIDCGERAVDTNRWVWDLLVPFRSVILFIISKTLKKRK